MNLEAPAMLEQPLLLRPATTSSTIKQVLEPGDYFCEVELARPCDPAVFTTATDKMGFEEVLIGEIKENAAGGRIVTFIGRLGERVGLIDTSEVRWNLVHAIQSPWAKGSFDSFANLSLKVGFQSLETHQLYEIRFVARMKSEPTIKEVDAELEKMGWYKGSKLCLLKKDTRLPGRPNAACAIWYGLARWRRNHSYITEQDPFYFEDAVLLENHPSSPRRVVREKEGAAEVAIDADLLPEEVPPEDEDFSDAPGSSEPKETTRDHDTETQPIAEQEGETQSLAASSTDAS